MDVLNKLNNKLFTPFLNYSIVVCLHTSLEIVVLLSVKQIFMSFLPDNHP